MPRLVPRSIVAVLLAAAPAPLLAQDTPPGPTPEQIELVRERRASFPIGTLVSQVDWYQPQETVSGAARPGRMPVKPPRRRTISRPALDAAIAFAEAKRSHALIVWRDGGIELEHYWPGFDQSSRFETASMHKTVMALALGAAVAAGRIGSVDDPLSTYLPALAGSRRGAQPLRAYLEMASGIETPPGVDDPAAAYWQTAMGSDIRGAIARWPDNCVARTEFCYANANSQYLGFAIEAATGMRYADWLSRSLWRPIGASDARLWLDHAGGSARTWCCLIATARDWLRVGRLLLDKGRANGRAVIPPGWIEAMTAPSPANPNYGWQIWRGSPHNPSRGYGKRINMKVAAAQPFARDDIVYLDGSAGQRVYVVPSERLVIVRIGTPSYDWDDSMLPNLLIAGLE